MLLKLASHLWRSAIALLRRGKPGRPDEGNERTLHLLRELEALDGPSRDAVARALSFIWESYLGFFGNVAFAPEDNGERADYVAKLQEVSRQFRLDAAKRPYGIAADAIAAYVEALQQAQVGAAERQLCEIVASLIEHGRALRPQAAESPTAGDLGTSVLRDMQGPIM